MNKLLYLHQIPAAEALATMLQGSGYGLDASDTGVGKTYTSLASMKLAGLRPLIICPKAVIPSWYRVAEYLGVKLLSAVNYELIKGGKLPWLERTQAVTKIRGKKVTKSRYAWTMDAGSALIFDEAHRCGGYDSQNSQICAMSKAYGIPALLLSATLADSVIKMRAAGYLLGLHNYRAARTWMLANGCYFNPWGGIEASKGPQGTKAMARIHGQIFPDHGVRLRTSEIPGFPETQITAEMYQVAKPHEIDDIYQEMQQNLMDAKDVNPLVEQLRARQQVEYLKVALFEELIKDYVDEGMSVVVFVCFHATLNALRDRFPRAPVIHGAGQTGEERQVMVDAFQNNEVRLLLCTVGAGGTGLGFHDLDGSFPRVSLISPSFNAVELKQALGRVHRAGAKSKSLQRLVYAANTVEEDIAKSVARKLNNIATLNDGDLNGGMV